VEDIVVNLSFKRIFLHLLLSITWQVTFIENQKRNEKRSFLNRLKRLSGDSPLKDVNARYRTVPLNALSD